MTTPPLMTLRETYRFQPLVDRRSHQMPFFSPWEATRDLAEARRTSNHYLTCDRCRHQVGFVSPQERLRFAQSSGWVTTDPVLERTRCSPCHQASDPAYYARREAKNAEHRYSRIDFVRKDTSIVVGQLDPSIPIVQI